jgi:hypothetical protein
MNNNNKKIMHLCKPSKAKAIKDRDPGVLVYFTNDTRQRKREKQGAQSKHKREDEQK